MVMYKYFSIGHFAPFIRYASLKYPNVSEFRLLSTIKIHGTHIDLVSEYENGKRTSFHIQSRNNVIDENSNMMGSVSFIMDRQDTIKRFFEEITNLLPPQKKIVMACEFAGRNIQRNVALDQVDRFLVILGVQVDDQWLSHQQWSTLGLESFSERIYNIEDERLPRYHQTLFMQDTSTTQKRLSVLVDEIEAECPFAATIFRRHGGGEGLVFHAEGYESDPGMYFKVKGPKYTENKVKTLRPISEEAIAKLKNLKTFVMNIVTDRRLEQGFEFLNEQQLDTNNPKNVSKFIQWVLEDVNKECEDDIKEYGFDTKSVQKEVANQAKLYYMGKKC